MPTPVPVQTDMQQGVWTQALASPGPRRVREQEQREGVHASAHTMGRSVSEGLYLWRVEQELVEVLQPRLNAVQDAVADGAQPLQSLRKGVHQALCPVDEEADGDRDGPGLRGLSLPCPTSRSSPEVR